VVLVQNSGWMEPFYSDPKSAFKPLVAALAGSVARPGDALVLAAFNQSLPGAPSPRGLLSETVGAGTADHVRAALAGLETARKPKGAALADTDLGEAVDSAVTQVLAASRAWSGCSRTTATARTTTRQTAQRNREFYALIHRGRPSSRRWPSRCACR
jgi:hypothetical protein